MAQVKLINIIALGKWNRKIFTPSWVQINLFKLDPKADLKGLFNPDELEVGYSSGGVDIFPKSEKLEIVINHEVAGSLKLGTNIVARALECLPHTPIKGIGFNIQYEIQKDSSEELSVFLNKYHNISFKNFGLSQLILTEVRPEYSINIVSISKESYFEVSFNFHYSKVPKVIENTFENHIEESKYILNNES